MSLENGIITGIFAVILAILGFFLNRSNNRANAYKTKAEALLTEAETRETEIKIEADEIDVEIKRNDLPSEDQKKIRKQTVKIENLREFLEKHNDLNDRYLNLLTKADGLAETSQTLAINLRKSETLRDFFEERSQKYEQNWLKTIEELKNCRAERDHFEKQAKRVQELEERVTKSENRVTALEKVLNDNGIPFDHV